MAKKSEEKASIQDVLKQLNKEFGGNNEKDDVFFISTGSPKLDKALGGGIVSGRITELIAWEGVGKTSICLHATADAQRQSKKVLYIDAEHALDENYAINLGVNWEDMILIQPDFGEAAFQYAQKLIETGEVNVVIFDSTSGMIPKSQFEAEPGGSNMGKHALLFSKEIPKINILTAKYNVATIFVSQLREKIGIMFGSPETTQAGNTLKFFASNRIDLRKSTQQKDGDTAVGNVTKFKTLKCKTAPPYRTGEFSLAYGIGIEKWKDIVDLAVEDKIITKTGNTYSYGEEKLAVGEEKFKQVMKDNPEFIKELEQKLNEKENKEVLEENEQKVPTGSEEILENNTNEVLV